MNQPIRLFREEAEPMEQPSEDPSPTVMPALPLLTRLQDMAFDLGQQAQHLQTNGQLILQDLYHQQDSLIIDEIKIEEDRAKQIADINYAFDQRRGVNSRQLRAVQYQIDYYTAAPQLSASQLPPGSVVMMPAIKRRSWREKLLGLS